MRESEGMVYAWCHGVWYMHTCACMLCVCPVCVCICAGTCACDIEGLGFLERCGESRVPQNLV